MLQVIAASLEIWRDGLPHCTAARLWSHGDQHAMQVGAPSTWQHFSGSCSRLSPPTGAPRLAHCWRQEYQTSWPAELCIQVTHMLLHIWCNPSLFYNGDSISASLKANVRGSADSSSINQGAWLTWTLGLNWLLTTVPNCKSLCWDFPRRSAKAMCLFILILEWVGVSAKIVLKAMLGGNTLYGLGEVFWEWRTAVQQKSCTVPGTFSWGPAHLGEVQNCGRCCAQKRASGCYLLPTSTQNSLSWMGPLKAL